MACRKRLQCLALPFSKQILQMTFPPGRLLLLEVISKTVLCLVSLSVFTPGSHLPACI